MLSVNTFARISGRESIADKAKPLQKVSLYQIPQKYYFCFLFVCVLVVCFLLPWLINFMRLLWQFRVAMTYDGKMLKNGIFVMLLQLK